MYNCLGSIRSGLTVITPPTLEPFDLADMKVHLRVDSDITDEDDLIESLTAAAREWVESYTGRTLFDTTLEAAFEGYPGRQILLPKPPVIEIVSFKYTDASGVDTTLGVDQYTLDQVYSLQPRLVPAYNVVWPSTRWQPSSLRIRYRAGYARAGSPDERNLIPASLKAAIKMIVAHLYEHRESVSEGQPLQDVPMGAQWLCRPLRVEGFGA